MNNLLIFFAFPIAVIIISAILQKVLRCPVAVAALIFAIFLIVTFAAFDQTFLIETLAYTILAFITAISVKLICGLNNGDNNRCNCLKNIFYNSTNGTAGLNNINNDGNNCNNMRCGQNCRYRQF